MMSRLLKVFGLALFIVMMAVPAMAHKVNLFAYYEDGKVFTESYFPDGMKVVGGAVEVYDPQNNKVASGKTDKEGQFSFSWTKKEDLTIKINATMGHKNEFILKKDEIE
jgi:nickel transport protein